MQKCLIYIFIYTVYKNSTFTVLLKIRAIENIINYTFISEEIHSLFIVLSAFFKQNSHTHTHTKSLSLFYH